MEIVGLILMGLGGIAYLVGLIFAIQLLVMAFEEHILWGLAYLFIPFASLVYVIKFWQDTKTPFIRMVICLVIGIICFVGGGLITGTSVEQAAY